MLSIQHCQKVLEESGVKYTEEEAIKIRDFIYEMIEVDLQNFKDSQANATGKSSDLPKISTDE